jgi:hypothetical protein
MESYARMLSGIKLEPISLDCYPRHDRLGKLSMRSLASHVGSTFEIGYLPNP